MAAANKVFETTELLEAILLHLAELSIIDLWKAQRINKRARAVIRGSHKLASRLHAAVLPGRRVPAPGSTFKIFDNTLFDCRLASERKADDWRRKLHLWPRNAEKPEGRITRFINTLYLVTKTVMFMHTHEILIVVLENKSDVLYNSWMNHWRYKPAKKHVGSTEVEGVMLSFTQDIVLESGDSITAQVSACAAIRDGTTMHEVAEVMRHLVAAHPFKGKMEQGMEAGTKEDPMIFRWQWSGYSKASKAARATVAARQFVMGEPAYSVQVPATGRRRLGKIVGRFTDRSTVRGRL